MIELSDVTDVDQAIARCRECRDTNRDHPKCVAEMDERIALLEQRRGTENGLR